MLVREFLACSEIGASRTAKSETIDTNILRSDANLSLQNLAASGVGLNFIIEDTACFMIAVDVRGLESLEVWVDVLITVGTKSGWCPLDIHDCCG